MTEHKNHSPQESADEESVLSDADVAMFEAMLAERHDPAIAALLERDRLSGGEIKRRAMRRERLLGFAAKAPSASPERIEPGPAAVPETRQPSVAYLPDAVLIAQYKASLARKDRIELVESLQKLAGAVHVHATKRAAYETVRHWIWAINAELTERDAVAPCVRPNARPGRHVPRREMSDEQRLILNDRQMFDLQFLHRNGMGRPNRKWTPLLRSEVFDAVLAATFVTTVGAMEAKVRALGLRDDDQMLLGLVRSDKIRKRWARLEEAADRVVDRLRADFVRGTSRVAEADIERWREEFVVLVVAEGSPGRASVLLQRLYGRSRPSTHLANRKRDLIQKGLIAG